MVDWHPNIALYYKGLKIKNINIFTAFSYDLNFLRQHLLIYLDPQVVEKTRNKFACLVKVTDHSLLYFGSSRSLNCIYTAEVM